MNYFVLIFCFRDATYDDFLADLTQGGDQDPCRYGLYDFEYMYHAQGTDAPQQVLNVLPAPLARAG